MDVGPDGFTMPKSPERGNEAGVFGILEDTRVGQGRPRFCVLAAKGNVYPAPDLALFRAPAGTPWLVLRTYTWTLQSLLSTNDNAQQY